MDVTQLSREQLNELKANYLFDKDGIEDVSYWEIYTAPITITDDEIFEFYSGIDFTPDDFFG